MGVIPQVAAALQDVFGATADEAGRATGFVRRASKVGGAVFARTLVFGWLADPAAPLEGLARTAAALGVRVSPQGLEQRFTEAAAACLRRVLEAAVGAVVAADPVAIPLLARFSGVYVQDSTAIALPAALAAVWPGGRGGGRAEAGAALKVQVRLELRTGALSELFLGAGRAHDRATELQAAPLPAGALRLADLGYFDLATLAGIAAAGAYWLSRLQIQTAVFDGAGRRRELAELLAAQPAGRVDLAVSLGVDQRLPARLLAARVPPEVAAERRRKLRAEARRRGQAVSKARLAVADWTVLVTNVPPGRLTLEEALVLARVRWQIELLFKLWKGHGRLDESRSAKPWRILCEVYAKLLGQLVQHWLLLAGCWRFPDRSLVKAARTVRGQVALLVGALAGRLPLAAALAAIRDCLGAGGRINKRKAAPHTYQLLLAFPDAPDLTDAPHSIDGHDRAA